jgi:hypothetical protein
VSRFCAEGVDICICLLRVAPCLRASVLTPLRDLDVTCSVLESMVGESLRCAFVTGARGVEELPEFEALA